MRQVLINISDKEYIRIMNKRNSDERSYLENIIYDGQSLPIEHGDLKDTDEIIDRLKDDFHGMLSDASMHIYEIIRLLNSKEAVIESANMWDVPEE